jgi:hypothetical protein
MDNGIVKIYNSDGLEIGSIMFPQKTPDRIIPASLGQSSFGIMTTTRKTKVWKDPETIILWAWRQVINSQNKVGDLSQGKSNVPIVCVVCGNNSILPKRTGLITSKWRGIVCSNPNCSMFNILIPANLFYNDPPNDILNKLGIHVKEGEKVYSNPNFSKALNDTTSNHTHKQDEPNK